jgi:First Longin domain of INTU, CCZ1 and HPS4
MAPSVCQLLVFDARRGNVEGESHDKVIAFTPASTPPIERSSLTGLFQGLVAFSANFTEVGAAWACGVFLQNTFQRSGAMLSERAETYLGCSRNQPEYMEPDPSRALHLLWHGMLRTFVHRLAVGVASTNI